MVIGDASGRLFSHFKGEAFNETSLIPIASSSKWFSAMTVCGPLTGCMLVSSWHSKARAYNLRLLLLLSVAFDPLLQIMKLLEQGSLSLDVPVNRYIPYWSRDPADMRSRVTLRSLLSFTSGYTDTAYMKQKV